MTRLVNLKIYFIRHGQTDENIIPLQARFTIDTFNSMMDSSPLSVRLNPTGIKQVESVAAQLVHIPFQTIVASPFRRAQETAAILARRWNRDVVTLDNLGEIVLAKVPWSGKELEIPFWLLITMTTWRHVWPWTDDEETLYQAFDRAREAWAELLNLAVQRGPIVVVSHLGFLRVLLLYIRTRKGCQVLKKDLGNGGISIVQVDDLAEAIQMPARQA
ncbi:histidine phosphatase family protein [Heliobacterium mobile]|nr:histidine phosphatase family protein [Heliobacterium mobile]